MSQLFKEIGRWSSEFVETKVAKIWREERNSEGKLQRVAADSPQFFGCVLVSAQV